MTITKYDGVAILPRRCDRCNRLFWLEPYNIFYETVGIEAYSLKQIECKNCIGKYDKRIYTLSDGYNDIPKKQDLDDFARWVASEIFDDMWEYNRDAFAEIACRKLAKLGIVRATGDEWELVEPQESEDE